MPIVMILLMSRRQREKGAFDFGPVHHPQAVASMTRRDYKPNLQEAKAPRSIRELQITVKRSACVRFYNKILQEFYIEWNGPESEGTASCHNPTAHSRH